MLSRRLAALTAGCALISGALAFPSSAVAPQRVTFVLRRTASGPTSFRLNVSVSNDHANGSFIGSVGARFERGKPVLVQPVPVGSARRWEDTTLHAGGTTFTACDVGVCHDDRIYGYHGLGSYYVDDGSPESMTHVFVVATGHEVKYAFEGKGWTLVRMPLTFRFLDGGDTSSAHAHVGMHGAEVFTDALLPGGRHGSIGVGIPPCSFAGVYVARGVGRLTLDGGATSETILCPGLPKVVGSYATTPTEWRFHGVAAGDNTIHDTRLFVLDLPARLP